MQYLTQSAARQDQEPHGGDGRRVKARHPIFWPCKVLRLRPGHLPYGPRKPIRLDFLQRLAEPREFGPGEKPFALLFRISLDVARRIYAV